MNDGDQRPKQGGLRYWHDMLPPAAYRERTDTLPALCSLVSPGRSVRVHLKDPPHRQSQGHCDLLEPDAIGLGAPLSHDEETTALKRYTVRCWRSEPPISMSCIVRQVEHRSNWDFG